MKSVAFVFTLIFSLPAFAQSRDTLVAADTSKSIIVTALRSPILENAVPYSMAIQEAPKTITGLSLADAITSIPGLQINDRRNFAVGDRIVNRGIGARTQFGVRGIRLFLDNMPLTMPDGQAMMELIDPQDIKSVEMLRGPGSSLYGNAAGGVLILHSSRTNDDLSAVASSTSGANALQKISSKLSGVVAEAHLSAAYSHLKYDGYRVHSAAGNEREFLQLSTPLSGRDAVVLNGGYIKFNALNPGALTAKELASDPLMAAASSVSMNASKDGYHGELAATWKHLGDSSLSEVTLYGLQRGFNNPIVGTIIDLHREAGGLTATYSNNVWLLAHNVNWTFGGDMALQSDQRQNHQNNNSIEGTLSLDQNESVTNSALFVQAGTAVASSVDAVGSVRYDRTAFGVVDHLVNDKNPDDSGDRSMDAVSPAFGIIYRLDQELHFFGNVATSFETPTTTELANRPDQAGGFNADLRPERTLSFELGARGSFSSWLRYDLAAYYMRLKDELIPYQLPKNVGRSYYRNAGEALHQGIEGFIQIDPLQSLTARLSASMIDAHFVTFRTATTDYAGLKIPGIAANRFAEELTYHAPYGIALSAVAEQVGRMAVNDTNSAFTDPYTIVDLRVGEEPITFGKRLRAGVTLSAGVKNLFNKQYVSSVVVNAAQGRYYEPGEGRYFYITAGLTFAAEKIQY
jgi:iron complex outermembrane receptor protein